MSAPTLELQLREAAPRLTARVLDEMYANPFWLERFGDRGRGHARKDGDHHVTYVVEALAAGDDRVFRSYARWLRDVLAARGMCSRHLAENFDRLAHAIEDEPWPERGRAAAILRAGAAALVHPAGDAAQLDGHRGALAAAATAALHDEHPDWLTRWGEAGRARCADDLEYHLSYLADALAAGLPSSFTAYVEFVAAMLGRRGMPREHLAAALRALATAVGALPGLSARPVDWLTEAAAALAGEEGR